MGSETTGIAETPEGRRTSRRKRAKVGAGLPSSWFPPPGPLGPPLGGGEFRASRPEGPYGGTKAAWHGLLASPHLERRARAGRGASEWPVPCQAPPEVCVVVVVVVVVKAWEGGCGESLSLPPHIYIFILYCIFFLWV